MPGFSRVVSTGPLVSVLGYFSSWELATMKTIRLWTTVINSTLCVSMKGRGRIFERRFLLSTIKGDEQEQTTFWRKTSKVPRPSFTQLARASNWAIGVRQYKTHPESVGRGPTMGLQWLCDYFILFGAWRVTNDSQTSSLSTHLTWASIKMFFHHFHLTLLWCYVFDVCL